MIHKKIQTWISVRYWTFQNIAHPESISFSSRPVFHCWKAWCTQNSWRICQRNAQPCFWMPSRKFHYLKRHANVHHFGFPVWPTDPDSHSHWRNRYFWSRTFSPMIIDFIYILSAKSALNNNSIIPFFCWHKYQNGFRLGNYGWRFLTNNSDQLSFPITNSGFENMLYVDDK